MTIIKRLTPWMITLGLMIAAFTLLKNADAYGETIRFTAEFTFYAVLVVAGLLSFWFHRKRQFFLALLLLIYYLLLTAHSLGPLNLDTFQERLYPLIALLLPLNILWLSFVKNGGVNTPAGKIILLFVALKLSFIYWMVDQSGETFFQQIFETDFLGILSAWTSLPDIAASVYLLCALVMFVHLYLRYNLFHVLMIGVLLATAIAMHMYQDAFAFVLFFSVAAVLIAFSIIQGTYSMAYLDELTGIPSRRMLREDMKKLNGTYSIAMLDIDFFKKFNDKYGHDVGDDVLKLVASCVDNVSGGGKGYRYGGEEFTVLFPKKEVSEVMDALESLRVNVSKKGYPYKSKTAKGNRRKILHVTISIGVAEKNDKQRTPDDVLKAADKALYRAKKKGRNQVSK